MQKKRLVKKHLITRSVHSTTQACYDGQSFSTTAVLFNNRPTNLKKISRSPVTQIPEQKDTGVTPIHPLEAEYRDVNNNKIKFEGKPTANVETSGVKERLELLITTRITNP